MKNSKGIVIHIDETLDNTRRESLTQEISQMKGVVSADSKEIRPHFMMVDFNPKKTQPVEVLTGIKSYGMNAQLIAWL